MFDIQKYPPSVQKKTSVSLQAARSGADIDVSELTEDAPDAEGNTIGHWCEDEGSTRWALVEPNLAELKKEMKDITEKCERLQHKLSRIFTKPVLEGTSEAGVAVKEFETLQEGMQGTTMEEKFNQADTSGSEDLTYEEWKEVFGASRPLFDSIDTNSDGKVSFQEYREAQTLSKQIVGLKTKREVLANMIEQYEPTKHAPECIAEGGQGMILVGKDLGSGERVAIKVERVQQRGGVEVESALQREFNVLYALKDDKSFPDILHFGRQVLNSSPEPTDCRVMVMDLLGASIADLWWETTHGSRGFEEGTAVGLAVRMLGLLEKLHDKGFIHRDLKPANFVMSGHRREGAAKGRKRTAAEKGRGRVCLIDFGISVPFQKEKEQSSQRAGSSSLWGNKFFGTVLYASMTAHRGEAQSYRDDLEALIYVFAWMLNGGLPWGDCSDPDTVLTMKRMCVESLVAGECKKVVGKDGKELCNIKRGPTCPCTIAVRELLTYCQTLSFDQRPDYALCTETLMKAYTAVTGREQIPEEEEWEWKKPPKPTPKPLDFMDLM